MDSAIHLTNNWGLAWFQISNSNEMEGATMSTGTGGKPDVPQSQAQMVPFDGEIIKLF